MGYLDDIRRRAEQGFAPGWNPKPGDSIVGVVEDVDRVTGTKYGDYDVVTVRRIVGEEVTAERVAIHAFHTSLAGSMARKWPASGGVLFVKYEGEKHNDRTDQDFHAYQYVYDPNPPEQYRLSGYSGSVANGGRPAQAPVSPGPRNDEPTF